MKLGIILLLFISVCNIQAKDDTGLIELQIMTRLKKVMNAIGVRILGGSSLITGNVFVVDPTTQGKEAIPQTVAKENILYNLGELFRERVENSLAPTEEGLFDGPLTFLYMNQTQSNITSAAVDTGAFPPPESDVQKPDEEGIISTLGEVLIGGLGSMIGGQPGHALEKNGNNLGKVTIVHPTAYTKAGHKPGIIFKGILNVFRNGNNVITSGLSNNILQLASESIPQIFHLRSSYYGYEGTEEPGKYLINNYKQYVKIPNIPDCEEGTEKALTDILNGYNKNVTECYVTGTKNAKPLYEQTRKIVSLSTNQIQGTYNHISHCLTLKDTKKCYEDLVLPNLSVLENNVNDHLQRMDSAVDKIHDFNSDYSMCISEYLNHLRANCANQVIHKFNDCVYEYRLANPPF